MKTEFAALIANWNGDGVIERCLGSVLAAARRFGQPMHLLVVDDASTDSSPKTIAQLFPSVELLLLEKNVGFGEAVNTGMRHLDARYVFLLNNDLALQTDYFERLAQARDLILDDRLFAIGAKTLEWETHAPNHAGMRAKWKGGMIVQDGFDAEELEPNDFVQGGACLIDREKFLGLGGFCPIFHPGYWEDYDVAYQALKRGWRNYYEPRAVAYHWGKRSMSALLGHERLALILERNHLLFNWINLTDPRLLARHLIGLGAWALRSGEPREFASASPLRRSRAFFRALGRLSAALLIRRDRRMRGTSDSRVLRHKSADH